MDVFSGDGGWDGPNPQSPGSMSNMTNGGQSHVQTDLMEDMGEGGLYISIHAFNPFSPEACGTFHQSS